jgi:DNA-binding CsgD family transcriptional regulator
VFDCPANGVFERERKRLHSLGWPARLGWIDLRRGARCDQNGAESGARDRSLEISAIHSLSPSADDLVGCIRDVLAGKTYLAPAAAAKLAEGVTHVRLTPRELATLRSMADGKATKEIASELDISERTVKTHVGHLFEKLGVTSRTEAVKVATRRGLVRLV